MSQQKLIEMTKHAMSHGEAGTIEQTDSILRVAASHYYDPKRWQQEMDLVFKRIPLMLAATAELPNPGDYKAITAAGVPVLISRDKQGKVNAMVNSCSHRGAQIMPDGSGNSHRFTCPYHAWSYNQQGDLSGIYSNKDFGDLDKSCHNLTQLPCLESAGLIWVTLNPNSSVDIVNFLANYDQVLEHFDLAGWHYFDQQSIPGPNWKIAYDGYLDFYHLPILHKDTFGAEISSKALYYDWGPHQRVNMPAPELRKDLQSLKEEEWPNDALMSGVWTVFPHISIASFDIGGRGVMVSQLLPGDSVGSSITQQIFLMEKAPNAKQEVEARQQMAFLYTVVKDEDYMTGLAQQNALKHGFNKEVLFGRNEGGAQNFHQWLDRIISTPDSGLNDLFKTTGG